MINEKQITVKKNKIPLYRIDDQKKINKEINKILKLYSLL